jgi:HAD superfamily hydrolase (TIGR01509 family)
MCWPATAGGSHDRATDSEAGMSRLKAVLWDVDGTLAETERDGHRVAFNRAFEACAVPWRWDETHYGDLLRITGGRERLMFDMNQRADAPAPAERDAIARAIHARKNAFYAELVHSAGIPLREGVLALMQQCRERGVRMGIATTTSRSNLDALLRVHLGAGWGEWFAVSVCGEDVQRKKPDPEVYVQALRALGIGPLEAVAIEDAPGGAVEERVADTPGVVTRSAYFAQAPIEGAVAVGPGLHDRRGWRPALQVSAGGARGVDLDDIEAWCAQMDNVCDHP